MLVHVGSAVHMGFQFQHHYTVAEAERLLPRLREWLEEANRMRLVLEQDGPVLEKLGEAGQDLGGRDVNRWLRSMAGLQSILAELRSREIQLKDLERGLVDFPALREGREVFLCWELEEEHIGHWHDLESGYAGRELL